MEDDGDPSAPRSDDDATTLTAAERAQLTRAHAASTLHARTEALRLDTLWTALTPLAQRQTLADALRCDLDEPPTLAELRADAHERLARLQRLRPGRGLTGTLPLTLIDVEPLDAVTHRRLGARWRMTGWAYAPVLQGYRPGDTLLADLDDIRYAAHDVPGSRDAPLPVYPEDLALRTVVAAQHIPLGVRLTRMVTLTSSA